MADAQTTSAPTLASILFERSVDGLCLVAPDGTIVRANAEWLRATGFAEEQVVGQNIIDLFPATRDQALAMQAHARAGHRVETPRQAHVVNGRETWWAGSIEPVPMEGGTGLLVTLRAVRDAPANLYPLPDEGGRKRSEARIRRMYDADLLGMILWKITGEVTDCNDQFLAMTGFTREDLAAGRINWAEITPREWWPRDELARQEVRETGTHRTYEKEWIRKDGSRVPILIGGAAFDDERSDGISFALDITDRKRAVEALRESDEKLRLATDAAKMGMWDWNLLTGELIWSARCRELFGLAPDAAVSYEVFRRTIHPDDVEAIERGLREAFTTGNDYDAVMRVPWSDGSVHWVAAKGRAFFDGEGRAVRMLGMRLDVTDRKRAEEDLREANERLREADRRKDEFLGMLSHELRNPLAPIRNATYILQRAAPGGEQARRAQAAIERQTEHLTRLVDDLLDVTRIARGKIELRRSRVDLRDVVGRAGDDYRWMMRDRGVRFEVVMPNVQVWADVDAMRIAQVVGNLLHNAAKFTASEDDVTLALDADSTHATIQVRDTGIGIDAALLPHVFEAFVQADQSLARTQGGLGLGLALVKGIAEMHGGTVHVESAGRGKGSQFTVRVPLVEAVVGLAPHHPGVERRNGGLRVLVVDDNHDAAESLADIVTMLGHSVEVAYDGSSAIEKARANPPNVVLCDIGLPGMSGYEVAKALRASGTIGIQLIAVSGYAQPEDVQRAIEAGFDGHIAKPSDPERIERLLS